MFDKAINEIGYYEASGWGANVISWEFIDDNPSNPTVRYYAIEHNEQFYFDLDLATILRKYNSYHPVKRA